MHPAYPVWEKAVTILPAYNGAPTMAQLQILSQIIHDHDVGGIKNFYKACENLQRCDVWKHKDDKIIQFFLDSSKWKERVLLFIKGIMSNEPVKGTTAYRARDADKGDGRGFKETVLSGD